MQLMQKKYKSMAESALLLKIIKHLPIFAGCPDFFQNNILINKILKEIKLVHHEKNAVLYKAGWNLLDPVLVHFLWERMRLLRHVPAQPCFAHMHK